MCRMGVASLITYLNLRYFLRLCGLDAGAGIAAPGDDDFNAVGFSCFD